MSQHESRDSGGEFFIVGTLLGLLAGIVGALLYAPKSGKEFQADVKTWANDLPDELNKGLVESKTQYDTLVDKTKTKVNDEVARYQTRQKASRLAKAKDREAEELGLADYS